MPRRTVTGGTGQPPLPGPEIQLRQVLRCPACESDVWTDRGAIPDASVFAGQALLHPIPGGRLLHCNRCQLRWRSVVCSSTYYDALYSQAGGDEWQSTEPRRDHQLVASALTRRLEGGDVLDLGCGNGALLDLLPRSFRRFGIEIGSEARAAARTRGVELVGDSFDSLADLSRSFDAIVACDVIEHASDPLTFLGAAMGRLRPGGFLVISTGNADAWLWRLTGARFWYSQFAEHLTFVSPTWLLQRGAEGAQLLDLQKFAYRKLSPIARSKVICMLLFYLVMPAAYARRAARRQRWAGPTPYSPNPPGNGLSADHLVATLRRESRT